MARVISGGWPAAALAAAVYIVMAARVCTLERGSGGDRIVVLLLMLGLAALAMALFGREYRSRRLLLWMALPVAAAFLVRAMCLDYASGDYNSFLAPWVEIFRQNGGFRAVALDIGDYNAPYLYFIAAISYLRLPDLYAYKLFSILFDVLLAWGCLRLTRALRPPAPDGRFDLAPALAFALALLLPTVVLNGSYWGQCDAIYGALVVHAVALALEGRGAPSVALMAVAFSFKLQTVFLLPLWGVLWLSKRLRFRDLWVFPGVYFLTILPALLMGKTLGDTLGVYFDQAGEYASLTLNAPSVFQFVPYGAEVDEPLLAALGIAAAFLLVAALLAAAFFLGGRLERDDYFVMAVALAIGVPFFLPHMHERYFFLADVLTLCWACTGRGRAVKTCLLTEGASLASYGVYLRLSYNVIVTVWGVRFVMPLEALMMCAALALTAREFAGRLPRLFNRENLARKNWLLPGILDMKAMLERKEQNGDPDE